jgi:hypothetical protein
MAGRSTYWSCSKFADWLRGTPKAGALTSEGWRDWNNEAKTKHPIRYWIAEEALDKIQSFIWWPIDKLYDIKYYINNRWITRTHSLNAHPRDIKPGTWCDVGNRFLPCLFNELVDFVEVELAWWHLAWSPENQPKYNMPWWAVGWWRIRTWRCPQAGLDNLKWQSELVWQEEECEPGSPKIGKPTYQAEKALEILALYKWWTEVYPNRPDPHDAGGWTEYCRLKREADGEENFFCETKDPKLKKMGNQALKRSHNIEQQYEREDEQMMIRLIKVRNSLWT